MKNNKIKLYAKALAQICAKKHSASEENKITERFMALLAKDRLDKKAGQILTLAQEIILQENGNSKIVLETARKMNAKQKELLKKTVKDGDIIKEKINPDLIAGIKIIINNNKQLDMTMAKKLSDLFDKV